MTNYDPQRPAGDDQYRPQEPSAPVYTPSYEQASTYSTSQPAADVNAGYEPYGGQNAYQSQSQQAGYQGYPGYAPASGYQGVSGSGGTNVLAILSLVSSILGFLFIWIIGPIAGIVLAHFARKQIDETGENGRGLATAGWWTGWVGLGLHLLGVLLIILFFVFIAAAGSSYSSY